MKFISSFIIFVISSCFCFAQTDHSIRDEIALLDDIIAASQENLQEQIKLRDLIKSYHEIQAKCLKDEQDQESLFQMIKTAHAILEIIKEKQLTQTFDPNFLTELTIVAKPASKLGIPKP